MRKSRGFMLRDAVCAVATLGVLGTLAVPVLSQVKFDASRQKCVGNYRFISQTTGSYVNDHAGKLWGLNWRAGMQNPYLPVTIYFSNDNEAQSWQAIGILRRLAGLTAAQSPVNSYWVPGILYSHLALLDYVNDTIPARFMICPEDWTRQAYSEGDFSHGYPLAGENGTSNWRWPYSSSYATGAYLWSPSRQYRVGNTKAPMWYEVPPAVTVPNLGAPYWDVDGVADLPGSCGERAATEVRYPSSKVFLSDDYARHNGPVRYYAYQSAGQDLLFFDGSVRYYRTDATNPGWNPTTAANRGNMTKRFAFTKYHDYFGNLDNGAASATFTAGWYRWTRGGLYGWDVPRLRSMVGKLPDPSVIENEVDTSAATGAW